MTIASFLLGIVISSIFGCAFHFWKGGKIKWLLFYNICAWMGFWLGNFIGKAIKFEFFQTGSINLGPAILGCILTIFLGYWLSMAGIQGKK
jgi:hypothetical protein